MLSLTLTSLALAGASGVDAANAPAFRKFDLQGQHLVVPGEAEQRRQESADEVCYTQVSLATAVCGGEPLEVYPNTEVEDCAAKCEHDPECAYFAVNVKPTCRTYSSCGDTKDTVNQWEVYESYPCDEAPTPKPTDEPKVANAECLDQPRYDLCFEQLPQYQSWCHCVNCENKSPSECPMTAQDSSTSAATAVDTSPVRRLGFLLGVLGTVSEMDGEALKETIESFSQASEQESMDVSQIIQIVMKILQMFMGSIEKGNLTSDEIMDIIKMIIEILSSLF